MEHCQIIGNQIAAHYDAFHQAELVCCLSAFFLADGVCQIRKFATRLHYQGQDYGIALIESVLAILPENNIKNILRNTSKSAISFYKNLDFL
ncbi:GNAT family N-acetyltransferase [Pantoea agglomerans]|jgi:GNAT superfamily N-acetyltransferase|uniref:GNAT family N-acetyltransferase n=1 Tax=Enterobacter agglomerans TaxID=549 RepID=UPI003B948626